MTKYLISVVGPTAIGKTALGISLAKHFYTEIISADSRQFFREMRIGTAVPNDSELKLVKHHFIQHRSIEEPYSVGDFERDALALLERLFLEHDIVVMVGGSGLYLKAVLHGLDNFPEIDPGIREGLNERLKTEGLEPLQLELKSLDPDTYGSIAIDNPHRVIRALEVCMGTGTPFSKFRTSESKSRPFESIHIGISADRESIYDRINKRVDQMMADGLLEEAKSLIAYKHLNALNTVGYKELFRYFESEFELPEAISEIKKNTRRFAKRQLTWFRKDESIQWFDYDTPHPEIIDHVRSQIKKPTF
ncbi:MAG: tRNA (adenosine(37)-N6)-dimethylallyltransferase MiaA [Flavobacteriaceae bacterium]|nr:tRNA (adenosine(37)-N6)-dimethylallyltransferase MiaA [Flavobacteriaceae bacterium]